MEIHHLIATIKDNARRLKELHKQLNSVTFRTVLPKSLHTEKMDSLQILTTFFQSSQWPQPEVAQTGPASIVNNFITSVTDQRVLDFGCGSGDFVNYCASRARLAVGYDLTEHPNWDKTCTTDWNRVAQEKYDIILLWDVLDHCEQPVAVLQQAQKVLADKGAIYVHCHPWCGRHGAHASVRHAFIHLVFTPEELEKLGITTQPTYHCLDPISEYEQWFRQAGLYVRRKGTTVRTPLEKFFTDIPLVYRRIRSHWQQSNNRQLRVGLSPLPLDIESVEYVLV